MSNSVVCSSCQQKVCLTHRFQDTHGCTSMLSCPPAHPARATASDASGGTLVNAAGKATPFPSGPPPPPPIGLVNTYKRDEGPPPGPPPPIGDVAFAPPTLELDLRNQPVSSSSSAHAFGGSRTTVCTSPTAAAAAAAFVRKEKDALRKFSAVTWEELQAANTFPPPFTLPDIDPKAFPSSWKIQTLLTRVKRDKVAGPNLLPPAVMKAGGETLSRQLALLFAKATAHAKEPLAWKGGTLIPLWKGKASPSLPGAYRSIFISNYSAKLFHQCVRQHLVDAWEPSIQSMQYGGRAGPGVDMAHHVVQCHQAWTTQKGLCHPFC